MAEDKKPDPSGFTSHTRSLAGEHAHEQGWGLNEEESTRAANEQQDAKGGRDYEYGARDFGDTAVDTSAVKPTPQSVEFLIEDPDQGDERVPDKSTS